MSDDDREFYAAYIRANDPAYPHDHVGERLVLVGDEYVSPAEAAEYAEAEAEALGEPEWEPFTHDSHRGYVLCLGCSRPLVHGATGYRNAHGQVMCEQCVD